MKGRAGRPRRGRRREKAARETVLIGSRRWGRERRGAVRSGVSRRVDEGPIAGGSSPLRPFRAPCELPALLQTFSRASTRVHIRAGSSGEKFTRSELTKPAKQSPSIGLQYETINTRQCNENGYRYFFKRYVPRVRSQRPFHIIITV